MDDSCGNSHTLPTTRPFPAPGSQYVVVQPFFPARKPRPRITVQRCGFSRGLPSHVDPSLSSAGPLEGLSSHDPHTLGSFPDAMDWLTPSASEAPTPSYEYDYEGTPPFVQDDPSLFTHSQARSEGDSGSPYTPPNGNPPLPLSSHSSLPLSSSHFDNPMTDPTPVLHQPKPTTPTASAFSDMWKDVGGDVYGGLSMSGGGGGGYSAEEAFDTLFEFDAGYAVGGEGAGMGGKYDHYVEGMGMGMVG